METFQDEFDVPDPTDWQGTPLASLEHVEQTLRCHVCKDFFDTPMITSCFHTFCSLCIRRCLVADGKCPLCRGNEQETKLRGNLAMREAVDAFVKARDGLLKFAKTPAPAANSNSPKRKATELEGSDAGDSQGSKRLRTSARLSKAKGAEATTAIMVEEAADPVDSSNDPAYEPEPDDGLVACPICLSRMKEQQVDKHLDTSCPGSPQPQQPAASSSRTTSRSLALQSSSNPPTKAPERIPSLAYGMMKDTQLRKKMAELGIPTYGTRQALEKRHREWVTIWNANCDSAHPKKRQELLMDLDVWERTIGSRAPVASKAAIAGAQIKDKDFDGAAWAARHDDSFKDLIANARKTRMQAQQKAKESSQSEIVSGSAEIKKDQQEPQLSSEPQSTSSVDPRLSSQPQTSSQRPQEHSQLPPQGTTQPQSSSQSLAFASPSGPRQTSSQTYPVAPSYSNNNRPYDQNPYESLGVNQGRQPYQSQPSQSYPSHQTQLPSTWSSQPPTTTTMPGVPSRFAPSYYNSGPIDMHEIKEILGRQHEILPHELPVYPWQLEQEAQQRAQQQVQQNVPTTTAAPYSSLTSQQPEPPQHQPAPEGPSRDNYNNNPYF